MELGHRNPDTLEKTVNQIALSNLLRGSAHSCKFYKTEYGKASVTEERKCPSFYMNYDYDLITFQLFNNFPRKQWRNSAVRRSYFCEDLVDVPVHEIKDAMFKNEIEDCDEEVGSLWVGDACISP